MLTVSEDERDLAAALRGGARGYLLKTMDSDVLASAILRTLAGESVVSPEMTEQAVRRLPLDGRAHRRRRRQPAAVARPDRTACRRASARSWPTSSSAPATRRWRARWTSPRPR
jgi:DNA-binding NarL/FixJ family response regulator